MGSQPVLVSMEGDRPCPTERTEELSTPGPRPRVRLGGGNRARAMMLVAVTAVTQQPPRAPAVCHMSQTGSCHSQQACGVAVVTCLAPGHTGPGLRRAGVQSLTGRLGPGRGWAGGSQSPCRASEEVWGSQSCSPPSLGKRGLQLPKHSGHPTAFSAEITELLCVLADQTTHNGKKPMNPSRTW